jgi:FMN phosphatase YigB (HAD superfamily)
MPGRPIRAILFDLGGTLIRYDHMGISRAFWWGARSSYRYLCSLGYRPGSYWSYALSSLIRLRWELLRSGWKGRDFNALELFKHIGSGKGMCLSEVQWEELAWTWYEPLARLAHTEPDLQTTIKILSDQGLSLGVLSNTFIPACCLDRHLSHLGLLGFFAVRLYSYQYPFRKPDSRIFLA